MKFFSFTYEINPSTVSPDTFWNMARIQMLLISLTAYALFVALIYRFKNTLPALHGAVHFVIYLNHEKMAAAQIVRRYIDTLKRDSGGVS
ncbi:hypothetical protein [Thiothrix winogradskyi]|uniref:Uncharacterized protein n=1 Tax=Thiothrix winogradskyi TaxID=96472 RepID=A0ABY3T054_9GAMM|nr:hypothetical protein [Thiothrix winogradskyi]UJS24204.1 hypothetical protein L2Y54_20090 [Thiothrix winogradskyi]